MVSEARTNRTLRNAYGQFPDYRKQPHYRPTQHSQSKKSLVGTYTDCLILCHNIFEIYY